MTSLAGSKHKTVLIALGLVFVFMLSIVFFNWIEAKNTNDKSLVNINLLKDKEYIKNLRKEDSTMVKGAFTKQYDSQEKKVLIKDTDDEILLDVQLLSGYNRMVPAGEDILVAELLLNDWGKRDSVFDILSFYDKKNDYQKTDKKFTLKYIVEEKTVENCVDMPGYDDLQHCVEEKVSDWGTAVEFVKLSELPNKNIKVGVFTDTKLDEKIEWVPVVEEFALYEWAAYDVTEIDILEFDTSLASHHSIAMIDATHFVVAYTGDGSDGFVKTFSIDGSYDNITEIDSLEFDDWQAYYNSIVVIDSTHFIIAYGGTSSDGYIKTFSIDGSYDNITEIDSLEHDIYQGYFNSLVMIDSTHFILSYSGNGSDGYIKTFSIDGSYDNITEIDSLEHDPYNGQYGSLVMIDSTHFILSYKYSSYNTYIKTFSIDGSYDNITEIDRLNIDNSGTLDAQTSLVKIDATHFILAYQGTSGHDTIKTFSIDGSYDNITEIDSLEHDSTTGQNNYSSLAMIDSTHFICVYMGDSGDGYIKTFSIDGSYDNITEIDSLEHDIVSGLYNSLVKIDSTHFTLAYTGTDLDGYVKTFSIEVANSTPTISSVSDLPDPVEVASDITFSVDWNDSDTEGIKMLVCKTDAITAGASPSCDGGEWASDKNDYDLTDPITASYTAQSGDVGEKNYYVFVCDDEPECSSSTSGTFTVEAVADPTGFEVENSIMQVNGGMMQIR